MESLVAENTGFPLLSLIIFLPFLGALFLWALSEEERIKQWALGVSALDFILTLVLLGGYEFGSPQFQWVERHDWIPTFHIQYFVGVDGISLLMVLMTALMTPLAILATWNTEQYWVRGYLFSLLTLETAVLGVFTALDLVLFYIFWEAMLIPLYVLIGVWGGERRRYATLKFVLYTLAGSVLMLVAILVLYFQGGHTFDLLVLMDQDYPARLQFWLFLAFFLAFAVKTPIFPFHTWLPPAYVESPWATTVILAAVVSKTGVYGLVRFCLGLFPDASMALAMPVLVLSVITILYGAFLAFAQTDYKMLLAYSSFSHMGFMTLGIFAANQQGMEGAVLQMLNHGISTGALFLMAAMIYGRVGTRNVLECIGVGQKIPIFITGLTLFAFSSFGLPGTNTFVGEFLVLVGALGRDVAIGLLAIPGVVLTAAYLLRLVQRMAYRGEGRPPLSDLNWMETVSLIPLGVLVFWIGFGPRPFLEILRPSVGVLRQVLEASPAQHLSAMEWLLRVIGS